VVKIFQMQCCGSGMFYPESGSNHFLILDPGYGFKHLFIPPGFRILNKKWHTVQTYFFSSFLCFQDQSLSLSQKDPGSAIIHHGSGYRDGKGTGTRLRNTVRGKYLTDGVMANLVKPVKRLLRHRNTKCNVYRHRYLATLI
jgi:hypothetical protein